MSHIDSKDWILIAVTIGSLIVTLSMGYAKLEEKAQAADMRAIEAKDKAKEVSRDANLRLDKLESKMDQLLERGATCSKK